MRLSYTVLLFALISPAWADEPTLDHDAVPATGTAQAHLTVPTFDRYAIRVTSSTGTALRVVDPMTGAGPRAGVPGEQDGRLDVFLDAGEVRVETLGVDDAKGQAKIRVDRYAERNPEGRRLDVLTSLTSTLLDVEQRSWWVEHPTTGPLVVEAAGRHVADLRLWRDGGWLEPSRAQCTRIEHPVEQPRMRCTLATTLGAGLYRVAVYGGPGLPWATPDAPDTDQLVVRSGVTQMGPAGQISGQIDAFGVARWWVPQASTFKLRIPRAAPVRLLRRTPTSTQPLPPPADTETLTAESRRPELSLFGGDAKQIIEVHGAPGQRFTLAWYTGDAPTLDPGQWLVASLHATPASDREPATGLVASTGKDRKVMALDAVVLEPGAPYEGRFNLPASREFLVEVHQSGAYVFEAPGAWIRLEPHWFKAPEGYETPRLEADQISQSLEAGRYRLELRPREVGPVRLSMRADGDTSKPGPRRPGVLFGMIEVPPDTRWAVMSPQIMQGWVARKLPLDPSTPVPVPLLADEVLPMSIKLEGPRTLEARLPDGTFAKISVDMGPWVTSAKVRAGAHGVRVHNVHNQPATVTLGATRAPVAMNKLPATRQKPAVWPTLREGAPRYTDLDAATPRNWRLAVSEPALYLLESTGLLAVEGALRTRTRTDFAKNAAGGSGRNFRVARYLRPADYRLSVRAQGRSAGRAGVRLVRTPLIDGGPVRLGAPNRLTAPANRAVRYEIAITEAGRYGLTSRVRGKGRLAVLRCRLEDARGYPVGDPAGRCDRNVELAVGTYRLIVLPTRAARRVTTLTRLDAPKTAHVGHGPHPLPFGEAVTHMWREPKDGGARTPDTWRFTLPAEAEVVVRLDGTMTGTLQGPKGAKHPVQGALKQRLPAGDWTLAVRAVRPDDRRTYTLSMRTPSLLAGQQRAVDLPTTVPVVVGRSGRVVLRTEGDTDVRARLMDAEGRVLARDDDRPDGWNVRLATRLTPGAYTLRLLAVGESELGESDSSGQYASAAAITVAFDRPVERDVEPLTLGTARSVKPGSDVLRMALPALGADQLIDLQIAADENVVVALEAQTPDGWRTLAEGRGRAPRLRARPVVGAAHRVLVEGLDASGGAVVITASAPKVTMISGAQAGGGRPLRAASKAPTVLAFKPQPETLWVCRAAGEACQRWPHDRVVTDASGPWLVTEGRIGVQPVTLGTAQSVPVSPAHPATVKLGPGKGPAVVFATCAAGQPVVHPAKQPALHSGVRAGASVTVSDGPVQVHTDRSAVVRLRAVRLKPEAGPKLKVGLQDHRVAPGVAQALSVPQRRAQLRITLAQGLVLATDTAVWHADTARVIDLPTAPRTLRVLNPTNVAAPFSIDVRLSTEPAPVVALGSPVEWTAGTMGARRIAVQPTPGTLHVRGADTAWLVDATGHAQRAEGASAAQGGVVLLRHGVGPLALWVAGEGADGPAWPTGKQPTATLDGPGTVPLSGPASRIVIKHRAATLVQVQVTAPFAAWLTTQAGVARVVQRPQGGVVRLWLPKGHGEVALRGLGGAPLWGTAQVSLMAPTTLKADGPGATVALAPGAARVFRFETTRKAPVGAAVIAEAESAELALLDATGAVLATGPAVFADLDKGHWLLVLSLPGDAQPTTVTPVLAGLKDRGDGPPKDVIQTYLSAGADR